MADDVRQALEEYADETFEVAPRAFDALRDVLKLHRPKRIYDECDHNHEEGASGVVDTGDFLTCEDGFMYEICGHCCVTGRFHEQDEECATFHDHRSGALCATVKAILSALTDSPDMAMEDR